MIEQTCEPSRERASIEGLHHRRISHAGDSPFLPLLKNFPDSRQDACVIVLVNYPSAASSSQQIIKRAFWRERQNWPSGAQIFIGLAGNLDDESFSQQKEQVRLGHALERLRTTAWADDVDAIAQPVLNSHPSHRTPLTGLAPTDQVDLDLFARNFTHVNQLL